MFMAATIGRLKGIDKNRTKDVSRLGGEAMQASIATWNTFVDAQINKDGSGYIEIKRGGSTIHRFDFEAE